jgi:hypothetical protein
MRKRKLSAVKFDSKTIIDVVAASLLVQKAPLLVDMIFPLDPSLRAVAGVGVGYLVGSMVKRPTIANASIALGVVDFVAPMLDGLFGGGAPVAIPTNNGTTAMLPPSINADADVRLNDYFRLNGYVGNPVQYGVSSYRNSYDY